MVLTIQCSMNKKEWSKVNIDSMFKSGLKGLTENPEKISKLGEDETKGIKSNHTLNQMITLGKLIAHLLGVVVIRSIRAHQE